MLVRDMVSQKPIAAAELEVLGTDSSTRVSTTDSNGFVSAKLLHNVKYMLIVSAPDYLKAKEKR